MKQRTDANGKNLIGERLKELRGKFNYSQRDLARELQLIGIDMTQQQVADYLMCNRQVYARYERGIREIPVSMIIKLAKLYKVSTDYILELK